MKFLRDRYTSARWGEIQILLADGVTTAAATLFSTGCLRREGGGFDAFLLVLWAFVPHAMARAIRGHEWPSEFRRSVQLSLMLVLFASLLALSGWTLAVTPRAPLSSPALGVACLLIGCWFSGFLLFMPQTYRLFDALVGGVMLLGIVDGQPDVPPFILIYLAGVTLSAPARHQLFDVFAFARRPALNLQNARLIALATILVAGTLFAFGFRFLYPRLDLVHAEEMSAAGGAAGTSALTNRSGTGRSDGEFDSEGVVDERRPITGMTDRMSLTGLLEARTDDRVVMRFILRDVDGQTVRPEDSGGLPEEMLWRGNAFSRFEANRVRWRQENLRFFAPRSAGGERIVGPLATTQSVDRSLTAELTVVRAVFDKLVYPYCTQTVEPVGNNSGRLIANRYGGIKPQGQVHDDYRYRVNYVPIDELADPLESRSSYRRRRATEYLTFPGKAEVGMDLAAYGRRIFARAESIQDKVKALRRFYVRREFHYDATADWVAAPRRLKTFLEERRSGNCVYFATATALLLRTADVATRVVAGYSSCEWNEDRQEYEIRNSSAHAWVEVDFASDLGWQPVDPVAWMTSEGGGAGLRSGITRASARHDVSRVVITIFGIIAALIVVMAFRRPRRVPLPAAGISGELIDEPVPLGDFEVPRLTAVGNDPRGRLIRCYHTLQTKLVSARNHRRDHETPREHALRHRGRHAELDRAMVETNRLLYRSLYGELQPEAKELKDFRAHCRRIKKYLG